MTHEVSSTPHKPTTVSCINIHHSTLTPSTNPQSLLHPTHKVQNILLSFHTNVLRIAAVYDFPKPHILPTVFCITIHHSTLTPFTNPQSLLRPTHKANHITVTPHTNASKNSSSSWSPQVTYSTHCLLHHHPSFHPHTLHKPSNSPPPNP